MGIKSARKFRHCSQRLVERFGIRLSTTRLEDISAKIENYHYRPILVNNDNGRSFHIVEVEGVKIVFLFDWEVERVITVYRMSWFKQLSDGSYTPVFYKELAKDIRKKNKAKTFRDKHKFADCY